MKIYIMMLDGVELETYITEAEAIDAKDLCERADMDYAEVDALPHVWADIAGVDLPDTDDVYTS